MLIRLKKVAEGVVLTCLRGGADAAVQRTGHGGFFALHDLMHYAMETTLGIRRAFFGLVAEGWDFESFSDRVDPRYRQIPEEAIVVEHLVGVMSMRAMSAARHDAELRGLWGEEINADMRAVLVRDGIAWKDLSEGTLVKVADRFEELARRWAEAPL